MVCGDCKLGSLARAEGKFGARQFENKNFFTSYSKQAYDFFNADKSQLPERHSNRVMSSIRLCKSRTYEMVVV